MTFQSFENFNNAKFYCAEISCFHRMRRYEGYSFYFANKDEFAQFHAAKLKTEGITEIYYCVELQEKENEHIKTLLPFERVLDLLEDRFIDYEADSDEEDNELPKVRVYGFVFTRTEEVE